MITKIKDLRGNPGLPLPALLAKKFSCCVSYCLVEVGDHGVQIKNINLLPLIGLEILPWTKLFTLIIWPKSDQWTMKCRSRGHGFCIFLHLS